MSSFTDYEKVSGNYDKGRIAEGADVIIGLIKTHIKKDVKDIQMLDAGCGTGNYSISMLQYGVGKICMVDFSTGMMSEAKAKLEDMELSKRVEMKEALLPYIPYGDDVFDVVMINQVLHHLEKEPDGENFPTITTVLNEVKRVLRPSGLLMITTTTREQMFGLWYCNLNTQCLQRYNLKVPKSKQFLEMLHKAGYTVLNLIGVLGHRIAPKYEELEGPLDNSYRDSDSFWSLLSEHELKQTLDFVRNLKETGELREFYKKFDKTNEMGYFVIINAQAPLSK